MLDMMSLQMLLLVAALGLMAAFLVGSAVHGVMGAQGFGPLGNTLILASGFVIGVAGMQQAGYFLSLDLLTVVAIASAFALLFLTALFKRVFLRV